MKWTLCSVKKSSRTPWREYGPRDRSSDSAFRKSRLYPHFFHDNVVSANDATQTRKFTPCNRCVLFLSLFFIFFFSDLRVGIVASDPRVMEMDHFPSSDTICPARVKIFAPISFFISFLIAQTKIAICLFYVFFFYRVTYMCCPIGSMIMAWMSILAISLCMQSKGWHPCICATIIYFLPYLQTHFFLLTSWSFFINYNKIAKSPAKKKKKEEIIESILPKSSPWLNEDIISCLKIASQKVTCFQPSWLPKPRVNLSTKHERLTVARATTRKAPPRKLKTLA